ncbi:hypothetical protein ACMAY5_07775 [Arenicellales bacterium nBUS_48]
MSATFSTCFMILIADRSYRLPNRIKVEKINRVLADPELILKKFSPSLPTFLRSKKISVNSARIQWQFQSLYALEMSGRYQQKLKQQSGLLTSELLLNLDGDTQPRARVARNIELLRFVFFFDPKKRALRIMIDYKKGSQPARAGLHNRALRIIANQTLPLAKRISRLSQIIL